MPDKPTHAWSGEITLVLCGGAGQGIQSIEVILTHVLKAAGYQVFACKEYMSRVRGGSNSICIRISDGPVRAFKDRIDLLVPLDKKAVAHLAGRIDDRTVIIGEKDKLGTDHTVLDVPFTAAAKEVGNPVFANTVAAGALLSLLGVPQEKLSDYLSSYFARKGDEIVKQNVTAGEKGYAFGTALTTDGTVGIEIGQETSGKKQMFLNGNEAVGLGALAGGCNFIASYPMSPSTAMLQFLAQHARAFNIVAEQAEDEISAVNMGLGAWYAGARAVTSTSGGGFALMCEGVSLAGITETPMVIYVAMRPGPATGLPTRTEQGDLDLVLYAGHGEFPRIILAPGTIEECYDLTRRAFTLADRFQVPVFVLTDQYLVDSYYTIDPVAVPEKITRHFVKTGKGYQRYALTDDGISPRGIPGFGDGLVCVDSDEHDESGHITEAADVRVTQMDKRLKKAESVAEAAIGPVRTGPENAATLVVGWGSTVHIINEALAALGSDNVAALHFGQVFPLPADTGKMLAAAQKVICVENNATGQFARLLSTYAGVTVHDTVLKYDGSPFSVEELTGALKTKI